MIPVLFTLWFFLSGLLFLFLFRVLRFRWLHRAEEIFFSCAAGLGWMSLCAVALGFFGCARFFFLFGAALGTGAAAAVLMRAARQNPAPAPAAQPAHFALCAAFLAWLPLVFLPPFFYDTLRYHYAVPAVYLRTGFTFPLPHFVESNYPLGGEMLAMIGMADASYVGASVANLAVFALCGLGTLCLADRLGDRRAGGAGLLLLLTSSTAVHTLFFGKTDLAVTLFFLACAYALLVYRQEGDRRFLLLAGALAGAALGTKYTAGLFVALVFALALAGRARDGGGRLPALARDAGLFLLAAAVVFSPWLYRNLAATGNPVYPLLNGIFQSPTWSPARMKVLFEDSHPLSLWLHGWRDVGRLLASATFFPDVNLSSAGASLGASLAGAILFPVAVRRPDTGWRFLRALSIALVAAWFLSSAITRYLLPALPFMALLSGALLSRLSGRGGRWGPVAAGLLLVAAVGAQAASISAESTLFRAWRGAFALAGHPERAAVIASRFDPSFGAARYANTRLPGTARILFLGETRHYYFERDAMVPSPFDEHPLQKIAAAEPDPEAVRRKLASGGYSHVLVNWPEWERLGGSYFALLWKKDEIAAADRFVRSLPAVYQDRAVAILSLEAPLRK
jgi:hypothetical protein